ncbi:hypothetical protein [Rudaea sp.]|uniref:hypothetical protein n=1 Tax=Rudaea sp. TaxID=2136325 RepID=UPI003783FBE5
MGSIGDGGRRRRASYYNTQQTAKRQDNALASQIRQQSENQRKADARTGQMIQQQSQQTDQKEKSAGLLANQNVLQAKAAQAQKVSQASGAVSNAYQQAGANAAQGITSYGNQQSDLLSSINAPGQALTSIAWEHASKTGRKIELINDQEVRLSMGRNGLTGITSCTAQAPAPFTLLINLHRQRFHDRRLLRFRGVLQRWCSP